MPYTSFLPENLKPKDLHQLVIGSVCPRPIALVSSISEDGVHNLAPYSFFNAISSNPPILMFSISTAPEPRTEKDTLLNIKAVPECVINIVSGDIARQMSLCSVAFPHGVSEFEKAGFNTLNSETIQPKRVEQSPVQFECTVRDILVFGNTPGAANVILCDVQRIHVNEDILMRGRLRIDPWKLKPVGRLGRSYYVNVEGESIYEMYQAVKPVCLGIDQLPDSVRNSSVLTGQDLAALGSLIKLPTRNEIESYASKLPDKNGVSLEVFCHQKAKALLTEGKKEEALVCALVPAMI